MKSSNEGLRRMREPWPEFSQVKTHNELLYGLFTYVIISILQMASLSFIRFCRIVSF